MNRIKNILSHHLAYIAILIVCGIAWLIDVIDFMPFKITLITINILGLFTLLLQIFFDDKSNLFPCLISIPLLIVSFKNPAYYIWYGIAIGQYVIGFIYSLIYRLGIKKQTFTMGKMFIPFLIALPGILLGGVIGFFSIINMLSIVGICFLIYSLYFNIINFTTDFKEKIHTYFIVCGILLSVQFFISHIINGHFIHSILGREIIVIGVQNINVVAIYFLLAMNSMFRLGYKNNLDYWYFLGALGFAFMTYCTLSRMATLIAAIYFIAMIIFCFIKSNNKKILLIIFATLIGIAALGLIIFREKVLALIKNFLDKGISGNGRQNLWPWCWEKFTENMWFGIGFTSNTPVPSVSTPSVVLAHNVVLQYLTSTGIVGTLLVSYFYIKKYIIAIKNFTLYKLFNLLSIILIALTGITDQASTMDVFVMFIIVTLIASSELDNTEISKITTQDTEENIKCKK